MPPLHQFSDTMYETTPD